MSVVFLFSKLAAGALLTSEISLHCEECRRQETLLSRASAGTLLQKICKSSNQLETHCKKRLASFPFPAGMSLTTLSQGRKKDVIYKLVPARESVVCDFPAGDGNIANLFLQ